MKKSEKKAAVGAAVVRTWTAWGVYWENRNRLDGKQRHLIGAAGVSTVAELAGCTGALMFETRRACREYIKTRWGYIRHRKDLHAEPYGWIVPKPVRIEVTVKELKANCT